MKQRVTAFVKTSSHYNVTYNIRIIIISIIVLGGIITGRLRGLTGSAFDLQITTT